MLLNDNNNNIRTLLYYAYLNVFILTTILNIEQHVIINQRIRMLLQPVRLKCLVFFFFFF